MVCPISDYLTCTGSDVPPLASVAGSCAVMILTQSAATSRIYAARHQQRLDADQDLVGLSAANAAAAFSGPFVVNGSPTQTAMVEGVGSTSQIAQVTTAAMVALVLLFLTKPLQYLPHCVLGALVFLVAIKMVDLRGLQAIRVESPAEYALALITAIVVVTVGVEEGILLAMVMSLLRIVHHSYHPRSGVMVSENDGTWKLTPPVLGAVTEPGLVLYRFGAALFYANASRFADEVLALVGPLPTPYAGSSSTPKRSPTWTTARHGWSGVEKRPCEHRCGLRLRPHSLEHPGRLRPPPPHRNHRPITDLQPSARRAERLRKTAIPARSGPTENFHSDLQRWRR